jgi:hypothetical protein
VDAKTLQGNALRSILRREDDASCEAHHAVEMPRVPRSPLWGSGSGWSNIRRKNSLSNRRWVNPQDLEARITKIQDGRADLAYKAKHPVHLDTGAVLTPTVKQGDRGGTATRRRTSAKARRPVTSLAGREAEPDAAAPSPATSGAGGERVAADKGNHSKRGLWALIGSGGSSSWSRSRGRSGRSGRIKPPSTRRCMPIRGGQRPRHPRR